MRRRLPALRSAGSGGGTGAASSHLSSDPSDDDSDDCDAAALDRSKFAALGAWTAHVAVAESCSKRRAVGVGELLTVVAPRGRGSAADAAAGDGGGVAAAGGSVELRDANDDLVAYCPACVTEALAPLLRARTAVADAVVVAAAFPSTEATQRIAVRVSVQCLARLPLADVDARFLAACAATTVPDGADPSTINSGCVVSWDSVRAAASTVGSERAPSRRQRADGDDIMAQQQDACAALGLGRGLASASASSASSVRLGSEEFDRLMSESLAHVVCTSWDESHRARPNSQVFHGPELFPFQQNGLAWLLDRERDVKIDFDPSSSTTSSASSSETTVLKTATSMSSAAAAAFSSAAQLAGPASRLFWRRNEPKPTSAAGDNGSSNAAVSYTHLLTALTTTEHPRLPRGGILADDMGLGKTMQILALLSHPVDGAPAKAPSRTLIVAPLSLLEHWASHVRQCLPSAAVVVVHASHSSVQELEAALRAAASSAAAAAAQQPRQQPQQHGAGGAAASRAAPPPHVVAIVTYAKLRGEVALKNPFFAAGQAGQQSDGAAGSGDTSSVGCWASVFYQTRWSRVILDEAHAIKNGKSHAARACTALRADVKWCLTGTPLQNRLTDLASLMQFLHFPVFRLPRLWRVLIGEALCNRSLDAVVRLGHVLHRALLRRRKDQVFAGAPMLVLPELVVERRYVELGADERTRYAALKQRTQQDLRRLDETQQQQHRPGGGGVMMSIFALLLRLRQLADDYRLLRLNDAIWGAMTAAIAEAARSRTDGDGDGNDDDKGAHGRIAKLTEADFAALRDLLAVAADETCAICIEPVSDAVALRCRHLLCAPCVAELASRAQVKSCPLCRGPFEIRLTARDIQAAEKAAAAAAVAGSDNDAQRQHQQQRDPDALLVPGAKCVAVADYVHAMMASAPQEKCVVFSYFPTMLKLVARMLRCSFVRLIGEDDVAMRDQAIAEFNTNDDVRVMLVSTMAGGTGLNLTRANHCILIDPWWNPAIDRQAMMRVHRIGQTRPVRVVRLLAKDTVDERIMALQQKKQRLIDVSVNGGVSEEQQGSNVAADAAEAGAGAPRHVGDRGGINMAELRSLFL